MHPYRDQYVPPIVKPEPEKHPKQIIELAIKAIEHLNHGCPSGIMLTSVDDNFSGWIDGDGYYRLKKKRGEVVVGFSHASPHSTRIMIDFCTYAENRPCCSEQRKAIKDIEKLGWYWSWRAKRQLNKQWIAVRLIQHDPELMSLLLPYAPKSLPAVAKYKQFKCGTNSTGPR